MENTILERQQEMLQEAASVNGTAGTEEQAKPKKPSWTQKLLSNTDFLCSKVRYVFAPGLCALCWLWTSIHSWQHYVML